MNYFTDSNGKKILDEISANLILEQVAMYMSLLMHDIIGISSFLKDLMRMPHFQAWLEDDPQNMSLYESST